MRTNNLLKIVPALLVLVLSSSSLYAQDQIQFKDRFVDNRHNWIERDDKEVLLVVRNGRYLFEQKQKDRIWFTWVPAGFDLNRDFEIESTITKKSGVDDYGYSIVWGLKDANNCYAFKISGDGHYQYGKWSNGQWFNIIPWKKSAFIKRRNSKNKLDIKKLGNQLTFYINNNRVDSASSERSFGDNVGFSLNQNMKIEIDHLVVKGYFGIDRIPPVITLLEPSGVVRDVNGVRGFKIRPISGKITFRGIVTDNQEVAALTINGINIPLGGTPTRGEFLVSQQIASGGGTFTFIFMAIDKAGNSTREVYELDIPKPVPKVVFDPFQADINASQYWALVVGVGKYPHPSIGDLNEPIQDARDVAQTLTRNYTFDKAQVTVLENPTRAQLIDALDAYREGNSRALGKDDNLLIFYAGHGWWDEDAEEGYWLPSDAQKGSRSNWVSNADVQRAMAAMKARHILLISDACFAGSLFKTREPFSVAVEEAYKTPSRKGITSGNLIAVPDRSVFKQFLIKRLKENNKPYLDAGSLFNSMKEAVTNNSPNRQRPLYGVIQQTGDEGGEFIFIRRP